MRPSRHFRPVLDCLQARIAPSGVTGIAAAAHVAAIHRAGSPERLHERAGKVRATADDETGSPGSTPTGTGSEQSIMTPPSTTTTGTTTALC